jgi:hypothetical protein
MNGFGIIYAFPNSSGYINSKSGMWLTYKRERQRVDNSNCFTAKFCNLENWLKDLVVVGTISW